MMTIRQEQMDVLNEALFLGFRKRLASALFEHYPGRFADLAAASTFVERNVPVAQELGITSERHIAGWLEIQLLHGEDFLSRSEYAWAQEILAGPESANEKAEILTARFDAFEKQPRER